MPDGDPEFPASAEGNNDEVRASESSAPADVLHVPRNDDYLRLLREEEEFWDSSAETLLSQTPGWVQQYLNERLTGDRERQWFEVISDFGTFRRGCVLGAGPGDMESHLLRQHEQLHLTIYDISARSLGRLRDRLEKEFPGRAEMRQEDLNFADLPPNTHDLVVAQACIHHILNLEHLAFQVNQALTAAGVFFMSDIVGESYFQYSEEKKRLLQTLISATERNPRPMRWPDRSNWDYSPFECARSGEILDVFGRYLREVRVRTCGAVLELTLHAGRRAGRPPRSGLRIRALRRLWRAGAALGERLSGSRDESARRTAIADLLFMLDSMACDTGCFKPGMAFAIYHKRQTGESSE